MPGDSKPKRKHCDEAPGEDDTGAAAKRSRRTADGASTFQLPERHRTYGMMEVQIRGGPPDEPSAQKPGLSTLMRPNTCQSVLSTSGPNTFELDGQRYSGAQAEKAKRAHKIYARFEVHSEHLIDSQLQPKWEAGQGTVSKPVMSWSWKFIKAVCILVWLCDEPDEVNLVLWKQVQSRPSYLKDMSDPLFQVSVGEVYQAVKELEEAGREFHKVEELEKVEEEDE